MKTSSGIELLVRLERGSPVPLHVQMERQLRAAARAGRLRPGTPLPSTRALAGELGVARGVVSEAYSQLTAEGYFTAKQGAATRVADRAAEARAAPRAAPPPRAPRFAVVEEAARRGVATVSLSQHRTLPAGPALILGYGQIADAAIVAGVRELAHAVRRLRSSTVT